MFVRRSVRHCSTCDEVTPHSRRLFSPAWGLACFFLLGALWLASIVTGLLAAIAVVVVLRIDRDRCWRVECERCRWNTQRLLKLQRRKLRPDPRYSTIDLFP